MDQARYAELFRTEAREHLAELDTALLAFEQHADPAHIATLFRSTHTIKGMAAAMGYVAVEKLSHALESLLDVVRRGQRTATAELIDQKRLLGWDGNAWRLIGTTSKQINAMQIQGNVGVAVGDDGTIVYGQLTGASLFRMRAVRSVIRR